MIIVTDLLTKLAVLALGVCGFLVARHIHKHKQPDAAPLVCPIGFDCHAVVHSDYSKFLGMPVEQLGMASYTLISLLYLAFILMPAIMSPLLVSVAILISLIAFLFSIYLISVQLFVIRKGCFWCYISSLICIMIFSLTLLGYNIPVVMGMLMK